MVVAESCGLRRSARPRASASRRTSPAAQSRRKPALRGRSAARRRARPAPDVRADDRLSGREAREMASIAASSPPITISARTWAPGPRSARAAVRRHAKPVAEAAFAVDHSEGQVLGQRRILQSVVEHEGACAPASTAICALRTRSAPTQHGATWASSSGSSPTAARRALPGRPEPARRALPRRSRATETRRAVRPRSASARAPARSASCLPLRRRNCRRKSPARRRVRPFPPCAGGGVAVECADRLQRAREPRSASGPPRSRALSRARRRKKRRERPHRALDCARPLLDGVAGGARHGAQARRIGEEGDQRVAEILWASRSRAPRPLRPAPHRRRQNCRPSVRAGSRRRAAPVRSDSGRPRRRTTCRRTPPPPGGRRARALRSCRRYRPRFLAPAGRHATSRRRRDPATSRSRRISPPRSGWRGAISVSASGNTLSEALVRLGGDPLLAVVGGGRDPDLAPGSQARKFGQFAPVGGQRRGVELDVACNEDRVRAERHQPLAVAFAPREAKVETRQRARRSGPARGASG